MLVTVAENIPRREKDLFLGPWFLVMKVAAKYGVGDPKLFQAMSSCWKLP